MSHNPYNFIVKFASKSVYVGEDSHLLEDPKVSTIFFPEAVSNGEADWQVDEESEAVYPREVSFAGWNYIPYSKKRISLSDSIEADVWQKDDKIVFVVNESPHSNVGYFDSAVVADNPDWIKEFCNDCKIAIRPIETNVIITSWG